ncbi:MAG: hypothetical protein K8R86_06905, partial [Bacteroidales bacterium]|nr:hypothetical protein [Bacteroidales bacterium]
LEEALEQNKVVITEKGGEVQESAGFNNDELQEEDYGRQRGQSRQSFEADGEVNKLYVENVSQDTVFLMAGEVVKGGKQDRVLASDMILAPNSGKVELPVFCVEHGRWSYGSSAIGFSEYFTVSANSVRGKAVKEKNQYEVWDAVAEVTEKQGAVSGSGTYTALEDADDYKIALEEYAEYFNDQLKQMDNCIGFVGVTGNRIIGCDIFATSELFEKQSDNLLDAYITEAIAEGEEIEIKDKEVLSYLNEFLSDESTQEEVVNSKGMQYKYRGRKLHLNTY